MTQLDNTSSQEILNAFQSLVEKQKTLDAQIETRAEEASRKQDEAIVEQAATYSVEGIVKGLADLQLSFDNDLDGLADTLTQESEKLNELQRAIVVANQQLTYLQDVQIAAEALVILKQKQEEEDTNFQNHAQLKQHTLEQEKNTATASWQEEDEAFEKSMETYNINRQKERTHEEETYTYQTTRARKVESDAFELHKLEVEREIEAEQTRLNKVWGQREAVLAEKNDDIVSMREQVEAFPQKLDDVRKESREKAIRKEKNNAKIQLDIMAKEMENDIQVYEMTVESLHHTINTQAEQIRELIAQLNAASSQTQSLAVKAIEGSNKHTA